MRDRKTEVEGNKRNNPRDGAKLSVKEKRQREGGMQTGYHRTCLQDSTEEQENHEFKATLGCLETLSDKKKWKGGREGGNRALSETNT